MFSKSDVKEVKELQNRVLSLLQELEEEYAEVMQAVGQPKKEDGEG